MMTTTTTTDIRQALTRLLTDAQAIDGEAGRVLPIDTDWEVGLEMLSARASIQKAIDILARQERRTTVVRSPALDAAYAAADELFC